MNLLWGKGTPCLIVAEIGQNHQGCLTTAKSLIREAKKCGVDCVKFQKTCVEEKFNKAALKRPYNTSNSWGDNYGDHKKFLEFTDEQFCELQKYAKEENIYFTASAMDQISADKLIDMSVPFVKIGSGDSNNLPMIEYIASKRIPMVVSTGMIDKEDVYSIYSTIKKYHGGFCLMHCVSSYPTPHSECNLNVLKDYQTCFPDICIGYSGHEMGISVSLAAVALGAKIIERHFTTDNTLKGSDHCCSLMPNEMTELVQQIRIVEAALGNPIKAITPSEHACINKLQKSLTVAGDLKKGTIVQESDVKIKVTEPKGINAKFYNKYIGKILKNNKLKDEPYFESDFN